MPTLLVPKQLNASIIPCHQVPCLIALCCQETSKSKSFLFRTKPLSELSVYYHSFFPISVPPILLTLFTYLYSHLHRYKIKKNL